jgi:hypothetical protein
VFRLIKLKLRERYHGAMELPLRDSLTELFRSCNLDLDSLVEFKICLQTFFHSQDAAGFW